MDAAIASIATIVVAAITGGFGLYGIVYNVRAQRRIAREDRAAKAPNEEIDRLREDLEKADGTIAELRTNIRQLLNDIDLYIEDARRARTESYKTQIEYERIRNELDKAQNRTV